MEKEKNGIESEHSVTSGTEESAADNQQKDTAESDKEEIKRGAEPIVEAPLVAAQDGTDVPIEAEPEKAAPAVDAKVAASDNIEDEPAEALPETNEPKLVSETSERSKEIVTEEITSIPTETTSTAEEVVSEPPKEDSVEKDVIQQEPAKVEKVDDNSEEANKDVSVSSPTVEEHHPVHRQNDDEHHETYEDEDFSKYTKEQLVEVVKQLGKDEKPLRADRVLTKIAPLFSQIRDKEKAKAFEKFSAEGGDVSDFSFQPDELALRFDANYRLVKDKKSQFIKKREREKQSNLGLAESILDKLRDFVDSEESSVSFDSFKAIQEEWKAIGDIPGQHSRSLWANYNALIHRFYDQRSIYFELKELDRKRNYDAKVKLCERAEALEAEPVIRKAINELNELHYDYKHLGPVPRELQEDLWTRFKLASDKIYEKRKDYVTELKSELNENLVKKNELAEEIATYGEFNTDQIKEWNQKSKEILEIQKKWDKIGGLPKDKAKAINKKFWGTFKSFFNKKKQFFKQLEVERDANLKLKQALVDKANELKESTDWNATANAFKALQQEWRTIGPVPGKVRNEIYEEFKKACDHFFNNKRAGSKEAEADYKDNLKHKKEIIGNIKAVAESDEDELEKLKALAKEYNEVGFVPKQNISQIKQEFDKAVEEVITSNSELSDDQKETLSIEMKMGEVLKGENSEKVLYQKEQNIRRQINKIENEVALWENNLEFFRNSKSANKLRDEFNEKIEKANDELDHLKRQLKAYRKL